MTYMVASRGVLTVLNRCMMTWREQYSVNIRTKPPIRYTQNAARANGLNSDQVLKITKKTSLSDDKTPLPLASSRHTQTETHDDFHIASFVWSDTC